MANGDDDHREPGGFYDSGKERVSFLIRDIPVNVRDMFKAACAKRQEGMGATLVSLMRRHIKEVKDGSVPHHGSHKRRRHLRVPVRGRGGSDGD